MASSSKKYAAITVLAALLLTLLAIPAVAAGEVDQELLAAQVEAIYDSTGKSAVPDNPRRVMWRAHRLLRSFRPEIQERLRPFLERPGGGPNEDGSPRAPGKARGERLLQGQHCAVYYHVKGQNAVPLDDGDRSGVPDYVELTAAGLDRAYQIYSQQWGCKKPPMKVVTVHFKKLNCNAICHPEDDGTTWLELSNDIIAFNKSRLGPTYSDDFTGDPDGPVAGMLRITTAHELFHSFQMMYDWNEDDWWCEGTAEWAGKAVNPKTTFYTRNLRTRFESPELSLFSAEGMNEYAASLYVLFLVENYGGEKEGPVLIRKIWEKCKTKSAEQACTEIFRDELNADFADSFSVFSCYNYLKQYADRALLRDMKTVPITTYPHKAAGTRLGRFGAAYYEFRAAGQQGTLKITMNSGNGSFACRLITVDGQGTWRIIPLRPKTGNLVSFDVPGFGDRLNKAVLVVSWHGKSEPSPVYKVKGEVN